MTGITTLLLAHDLERIRYPYLPCINSVLPISDEVLVIDCDSTDESMEKVRALNDPRIRILKGEWSTTDFVVQSRMINMAIPEVKTKFLLQIDADEVLHEDSYKEMEWIIKNPVIEAARPNYIHFTPDFHTTWPFIYSSRIRIAKTNCGWHSVGDACDLDRQDKSRVYQTKTVQIFHYGKVHTGRRKEGVLKEYEFQQLYKTLGFPDPLVIEAWQRGEIDYSVIFAHDKSEGKFKPFTGSHPAVVKDWISEMEKKDLDERNTA